MLRARLRWSPGAHRRALFVALFIFFACIISILISDRVTHDIQYHHGSTAYQLSHGQDQPKTSQCPLEDPYIRRHSNTVTREIVYHSRCIRVSSSDATKRTAVSDIQKPLLDSGRVFDRQSSCDKWQETPCEPIDLDVPRPFPAQNYPELIFGLATTFDRLLESLPQLSHWLSGSGARFVVAVVDGERYVEDLPRLLSLYREQDIDLIISPPWDTPLGPNEQHFTIIRDLLRHLTPKTRWVGIIDDDTFFPSLYPLSVVLASQDHTEPAYLGALSDSLDAIQRHGLMAYGGAGVFLSIPLARKIEPLIERCLLMMPMGQGDGLLKKCITTQTDTKLALLPGLNQLDIQGDPSGFYESGRYPLSLHHWKSWHQAAVGIMAKAADFCGSCMLQRWRFDSNTVLSNGYSIALYKEGIELDELDHTEATFEYKEQFEWSYGPLRNKTENGMKKTYQLVDSEVIDGTLRQLYLHKAKTYEYNSAQYTAGHPPSLAKEGIRDEFVELRWDWSSVLSGK